MRSLLYSGQGSRYISGMSLWRSSRVKFAVSQGIIVAWWISSDARWCRVDSTGEPRRRDRATTSGYRPPRSVAQHHGWSSGLTALEVGSCFVFFWPQSAVDEVPGRRHLSLGPKDIGATRFCVASGILNQLSSILLDVAYLLTYGRWLRLGHSCSVVVLLREQTAGYRRTGLRLYIIGTYSDRDIY